MRTAGCTEGCLNTAGRGGISKGGILTYAKVKPGKRKRDNRLPGLLGAGREPTEQ